MAKKYTVLFVLVLLLAQTDSFAQRLSVGGYNVYFGTLHNHSNVSDGMGTPNEAYKYAFTQGDLDFFSLADHANKIEPVEWETIKEAADKFNKDGIFTAFSGFEWSSDSGHVAVINPHSYCSSSEKPENTFHGFINWLKSNECVAFFNHPGRQDMWGNEYNHFMDKPCDKFVGIELWNGRSDFHRYYYNDGYFRGDNRLSYYDEANTRGWKLGAAGSEDNHIASHGTFTNKRLAILSDTLTRTSLYEALKCRRFYSTLDKNLALSFKVGGHEMGSVIKSGVYDFQVIAHDNDNECFTQVQIYKNGNLLKEWQIGETELTLSDRFETTSGDYFYVKISQQDGNEAISSPVFIQD